MEDFVHLVSLAQKGDTDAFTALVLRFQEMAYGYAYATLGDFPLAEDVAQEAFIEAFRFLPDLRQPEAFPAWFKRILLKQCDRVTRRKRWQIQPIETSVDLISNQPGPAAITEKHELEAMVRSAIMSLPLDQRVATALFYINGYSQEDIARFLEVPGKTVKSRLYAARQKLKERMVQMVDDEFKQNPLPEQFARETVEKAVREAHGLNQEKKYTEAEKILRDALVMDPDHLGALKELNRAINRGKVLMGSWELLPDLVQRGQRILKEGEDEATLRELAKTLLAIPAIPQAIAFIEQWIQDSGQDVEKLGMLAWAKAVHGDFKGGYALWQELLPLIDQSQSSEDFKRLSFITMTLVDAFTAQDETSLLQEVGLPGAEETLFAQQIAQQGWETSHAAETIARIGLGDMMQWINIFHEAGLNYQSVARLCLKELPWTGLEKRGKELCLRLYLEDVTKVMREWLVWVADCIAAQEWRWLQELCHSIIWPLRLFGLSDSPMAWGQKTWEILQAAQVPIPALVLERWNETRFYLFTYYDRNEWEALEHHAWRAIQEWKLDENANALITATAAQGKPTPVELVQAAEAGGIESVNSYGLWGWYMIAREAAADGEEERAFNALRRSLSYWSNPPYLSMHVFENDVRWGKLQNHPTFKAIFEEKRRRVGPIFGILHYFPEW